MTSRIESSAPALNRSEATEKGAVYTQGMVAGVLGAAVIAVWFFILDTIEGRPLYTPTVLGTALFRSGQDLPDLATLAPSMEVAFVFTWIHTLVFVILGCLAARLLDVAEAHPNLGFGILVLFVIFECGFIAVMMTVAEPLLQALAWPKVLIGNLLAAGAMAVYFWRRHPNLQVPP